MVQCILGGLNLLKDLIFQYFDRNEILTTDEIPRYPGSLFSLLVHYLHERSARPLLIISDRDDLIHTLQRDFPDLALLPETAVLPSSFLSPHLKIQRQLTEALDRLVHDPPPVSVVHPGALLTHMPGRSTIRELVIQLNTGNNLNTDMLMRHLSETGYEPVDVVRIRGEFSRRGDIIDIFPINAPAPVRIQLDFDEIASIRQFDAGTQRSREIINHVRILPTRLFRDTPDNRRVLIHRFQKRFDSPDLTLSLKEKLALIEAGELEGFDHYFHLAWPDTGLDLFRNHVVLLDDVSAIRASWSHFRETLNTDFAEAVPRGYLALDPDTDFAGQGEVDDFLAALPTRRIGTTQQDTENTRFRAGGSLNALMEQLRTAMKHQPVLIGVRNQPEEKRLTELLFDNGIRFNRDTLETGAVTLAMETLLSGFEIQDLVTFLPVSELFPSTHRKPARPPSQSPFFSDFSDIKPGDHVVHVDYGVARYAGLRQMAVDEVAEECLQLVFQGDARVLLPVSKLHLLQKYQHAGAGQVQLSSLRTNTWKNTRRKVQREVSRYAEELLRLYAMRKMTDGIACATDSMWQREFEEAFPFDETEDQLNAIQDIKRDMESASPMDRLLCGDVGFGKTEVAMRAAFKAIDNGRQVMVLAPTTVLAFQHMQTFSRRFERFPVRIEMLSRFVSAADQKTTVQSFREGQIDILIGTHRIFSNDIVPKKLGLLIVDEEQKFGVIHKEKLKILRKNIDVISLSATPIPRTLNLSVMGLKDISVIESPPRDRLAVNTYHIMFDPVTIQEGIQFELKRGGQIYVVNNHIQTIDTLARTIRKLAPEGTRIAVAHGQMNEKDLESVMIRFFNREVDILVSTAIIENGMDVPTANTMFINEAHTFGLSQLYQLRGRIGRSDKPAYAYLITPGKHTLTDDARKRLQALEEFSHLGAGFRIAMLDLELRGAGDILGERQSGHIQSVGFEMYLGMLEAAVRELKEDGKPVIAETVLEMGTQGRIPTEYIESASVRLAFYRRMGMADHSETLLRVREEMEDRFGTLPPETRLLLDAHRTRLKARTLGMATLTLTADECQMVPGEHPQLDTGRLVQLLPEIPGSRLDPKGQIRIPRVRQEAYEDFLNRIRDIIDRIRTPDPA